MSKFNQTNTIKTTNKCGHIAYAMPDKEKLVTQVLTSFFGENKYYGDTTNDMIKTANAVLDKDAKFVANLARYARKEMHLRSVSHALTALIANNVNGKPFIKEVVKDVVERADDITEILACYINMFGKPIPNGLKKALGNALLTFNEYQVSKYNGGNKSVKFKDILRICHTKPKTKEQEKLFNEIVNDTLPIADRWETELSANGNNKETWEKLIAENKLGYMAALRNLRNIILASPDNIDKIYAKLADKEQVLKSKQLPFRFYSAYDELCHIDNITNKPLDTLNTAIEYSVDNLPKLKGKTVIAIDTSGSMGDPISVKSKIKCVDIARLMAVLASRICDEYIIYTFDTNIRQIAVTSKYGILDSVKAIPYHGGGTNLQLPLVAMLQANLKVDRLIILSDNQINIGYFGYMMVCQSLADKYRQTINKDLWVHAIDLQGYGTQQFVGKNTNIIAGWNEKVLEFINLAEQGIDTQIKRIAEYQPPAK